MSELPAVAVEVAEVPLCRFGHRNKCAKRAVYSLGGHPLCGEHAAVVCRMVPAAREKLTPWGREEDGDDERAR